MVAVRFVILLQERPVLEDVSIQIAGVRRFVRQKRTAEAHQLDIQAIFLFGDLFSHFRDILFRAVDDADFNVFRIATLLVAACQQQTRQHHGGDCP